MYVQSVIHNFAGYWLKLVAPPIMLPCLQFAPWLPVSPLSLSVLSRIHSAAPRYYQVVGSAHYTYKLATLAYFTKLAKWSDAVAKADGKLITDFYVFIEVDYYGWLWCNYKCLKCSVACYVSPLSCQCFVQNLQSHTKNGCNYLYFLWNDSP
jgi:hypothetical protein